MSTTPRDLALAAYHDLTDTHEVTGIEQRGRDPRTARITLVAGDRRVHLGTIESLWSHSRFSQAHAIAFGSVPQACKAAEWRDCVGALLMHVVTVVETPGEAMSDTVAEWIGYYATAEATQDQEGAVPHGRPFWSENGELHLTAGDLGKYVRREFAEPVNRADLIVALTDLGYTRRTIHYRSQTGKVVSKTSKSYYVGTPEPTS